MYGLFERLCKQAINQSMYGLFNGASEVGKVERLSFLQDDIGGLEG
jgi:hypothetical protein